MQKYSSLIIAVVIVIGLTLSAFILGKSIQRFKSDDRYISVKGFSEKEVKADFVIWSLKLRIATNDLQEGSKSMEVARQKVIRFLTKNGIDDSEIIRQGLTVSDRQANEYTPPNGLNLRYVIEETVEVRSNNVDTVQKVSRMTSELLDAGVALAGSNEWRGSGLKFLFTKLNTIKPEMLADATRNAGQTAEQFTKESKTVLGKMRKANQGLFSILDRDESLGGQPDGNYSSGTIDLYKKIRVVISVEYSIE